MATAMADEDFADGSGNSDVLTPRAMTWTPINSAVARLNTTSRALRHYEAFGLIRSERGTGNSRRYDQAAMADLETIVMLRRVDISLSEIATILSLRPDPSSFSSAISGALKRVLALRQRALDEVLELMDAIDDQLERRLGGMEPRASGQLMSRF